MKIDLTISKLWIWTGKCKNSLQKKACAEIAKIKWSRVQIWWMKRVDSGGGIVGTVASGAGQLVPIKAGEWGQVSQGRCVTGLEDHICCMCPWKTQCRTTKCDWPPSTCQASSQILGLSTWLLPPHYFWKKWKPKLKTWIFVAIVMWNSAK